MLGEDLGSNEVDSNRRRPLTEIEVPDLTISNTKGDSDVDSADVEAFVPALTIHEKRSLASHESSRPRKKRGEVINGISETERAETVGTTPV
jgi:hypothetical protein